MTNLLLFLDAVSTYVDKGVPVDAVYLDFRKAFDKVPHKRLIMKVNAHGIIGKVSEWITEWLRDREQRVVLHGEFSDWIRVTSGVPQGSVLGPTLFLIYINDLERDVSSMLFKFADDTKMLAAVKTVEDAQILQGDLRQLSKWSEDWLMLFNSDKCKVVHFGSNNGKVEYTLNQVVLESVTEEKDLGVLIRSDLKVSNQCHKAVSTANRVLGMIKRTFSCREKKVILTLYKALVRPHLEYCVQAWRPYLVKDIAAIERVQKRATRLIGGFHDLSYEERLTRLGLTSLETRRLRGDLLEVFKIIKGFDKVDAAKLFDFSTTNLRGHKYKLFKRSFRTNLGKFSFVNRVTDTWNRLPEDVVDCSTVACFKSKLDHLFKHVWRFT